MTPSTPAALITCCVCQERTKRPFKTLPCFHSACAACIDASTRKGELLFTCPLCRCPIEAGDAAALQSNYFTSHLLTSSSSSAPHAPDFDPNNLKCENCEESDATAYCQDCKLFFCGVPCQRTHLKSKATSHHQFVSLQEGLELKAGGGGGGSSPPPYPNRTTRCHLHSQYEVNSYCEICREACCPDCVVDHHSGHVVIRLTAVADRFTGDITVMKDKVKPYDDNLSQAWKKVTDTLATLNRQAKATEAEIRQTFEKLRQQLVEREAELIVDMEAAKQRQEEVLLHQKNELEFSMKGVRTFIMFGEKLIEEGSGIEVAASHKAIRVRYETIEKEMAKAIPPPAAEGKVELTGLEIGIEEIKRAVRALGAVVGGKRDSSFLPAQEGLRTLGVCARRDYAQISDTPGFRFGSNGLGEGQFNSPFAVASNVKGQIIVADSNNHRIQVFDRNGRFLFKFGSKGFGHSQFNHPYGVTFDHRRDNQIVVTDSFNHRIQIFDEGGGFLRSFGSEGNGDGQFNRPLGVFVDPTNGNYIVADHYNHRVQIFNPDGRFIRKFGCEGNGNEEMNRPWGIGMLSNGHIVVSEFGNKRLQVFTPEGRFVRMIGNNGGKLVTPLHLFVDGDDNILVADNILVKDYSTNRVQIFSQMGQLVRSLGVGQLSFPSGVCMDGQGRIIVSEGGTVACRLAFF